MPKSLSEDGGFQMFVEILCDPSEVERTNEQIAAVIGVNSRTIYRWRKKVDWEMVKAERRKRFAERITQVDDAMFRKAVKGDVSAADLLYQRFDAWVPTTKQQTEHSVSETEVNEALSGLIERKRAAVAAMDSTGRAEVAGSGAGEVAPSEGGAASLLPAEPSPIEVHSGDSQGGAVHRD